MVTLAALNLAQDVYPSLATNTRGMDLVLCRNVLLYFDEDGARAVVGRLRDALAVGGSLLVSPTEVGLGVFDGLTQDVPGSAIYRKVEPQPDSIGVREREPGGVRHAAAPTPAARSRSRAPVARARASAREPATAHAEALALWKAGDAETALRQLEAMTESHPLAACLHYLHGLILLDAERTHEALAAFRRCTYADPACALGHLSQVGLFARAGLRGRALTALENAARLVDDLDPDTVLSLGDGVRLGDFLELIASQRQLLAEPDGGDGSGG
jgi:chemotaxis protein methyltransferase CheR